MHKVFSAAGRGVLCALMLALCAALLIWSDAVRGGVLDGLRVSGQIVIPSLYPFMALSGMLAQSEAGELIGRPLAPLARRVFRLPPCLGPVLLLSALGGYPVGAKLLSIQLEQGRITRQQAERALCFCCNAGPSFVVTAVGARLMGSARAGMALLFIHLITSLFIGLLLARGQPIPKKQREKARGLPPGEALVTGVSGAASGIFTICAYVVIFSALGALLKESGICARIAGALSALLPLPGGQETVAALLLAPLEVTSGCIACAALPGRLPLILIPFFLSFAGLSIFFQIRATLQGYALHFGRFFACRVLHGALTAACAYPLLRRMACHPVAAFRNAAVPVPYHTPDTPLGILFLLGVTSLALWSLTPERGKEKGKAGKR